MRSGPALSDQVYPLPVINRFQFLNVIASVLLLGALALLSGIAGRRDRGEVTKASSPHAEKAPGGEGRSGPRSAPVASVAVPSRSAGSPSPRIASNEASPLQPSTLPSKSPARTAAAPRRHLAALRESRPRPLLSIDPSLPGNSLPLKGGRLFVEAFRAVPGAASPELEVSISKNPPASPAELSAPAIASSMTAAPVAAAERQGLTYEQELFRTKWGWVAFDQAQRAGSELGAAQ